jgi:D-3-phosphoglycerate dehydrogenase
MKILVTDGMDKKALATLREMGHEVVEQFYEPDQLGAALKDFDAVVVRSKTKVRANHIDEAAEGRLKLIIRGGVGVDNIDVAYAESKGMTVKNTPRASSQSVAELALAHMLSCARFISHAGYTMRSGLWEKKTYGKGIEICGKTLGIIGYGNIGRRFAKMARGLDMRILAYDPFLSKEFIEANQAECCTLDEIYAQADVITVHLPLTDLSRHMINREAIAKMKDGVILINMARDLLVDEKAVIAAIEAGKIRRYVSDFPNPTIAGQKGCITIPHLGASTEESEENCAVMAVREIREYLENGNIANSVNYPRCDMGICEHVSRIAIFHRNVANMITQFTAILGETGVNIAEMSNKSRGDIAYTMLDLDSRPDDSVIERLSKVEGVFRVRAVK